MKFNWNKESKKKGT